LIVEEYLAALPSSVDLTAAKLKALDADNQAVYVTETKNATCLIRARFAERARIDLVTRSSKVQRLHALQPTRENAGLCRRFSFSQSRAIAPHRVSQLNPDTLSL